MSYSPDSNDLIDSRAPDFETVAYVDGRFKNIKLSDYRGSYLLLVFYPFDFYHICATELQTLNDLLHKFRDIDCHVLVCSVDSQFCHKAWADLEKNGVKGINIPMLSDQNHRISENYGVFCRNKGIAYRGTVIINAEGIIRHHSVGSLSVPRRMKHFLKMVLSLQNSDRQQIYEQKWKLGENPLDRGSTNWTEY